MIKISEGIKRVVLLDGNNDYGALCAASLAISPLLRSEQRIVLTNCKADAPCVDPSYWAEVRRYMCLSKTAPGTDPASLQSVLPRQYYQGRIYPENPNELSDLLNRVDVVANGEPLPSSSCLYVMVLNADLISSGTVTDYVQEKMKNLFERLQSSKVVGADDKSAPHPFLLIADERCRRVLQSEQWHEKLLAAPLRIHFIWVRELCGPALDYSLTLLYYVHPQFGVFNTLSQLCLNTLLGVPGHLNLKQSDRAPFAPVDIAMQVGLLAHFFYEKEAQAKHISVSVSVPPAQGGLVWGMTAEYIVNYYGRFATPLKAVFDELNASSSSGEGSFQNNFSSLISGRPYLYFNLTPKEITTFGLSQMDISSCARNKLAARRRARLVEILRTSKNSSSSSNDNSNSNSGADPSEQLQALFKMFDANMARHEKQLQLDDYEPTEGKTRKRRSPHSPLFVETPLNTPPTVFNVKNYPHLLMRVTSRYEWNPVLQCTSLVTLDYERFMGLIAQCAIVLYFERTFPAKQTTDTPPSSPSLSRMITLLRRLPPLKRHFFNDFDFSDPNPPRHPSRSRYLIGLPDWLLRCGMRCDGALNPNDPGMTPARLAAILNQPNVRRAIVNLSQKDGVALTEVELRAKRILLRIGDTLSHQSLRAAGILVRALLRNVFTKINTEDEAYLRLRRMFQIPRTQVVLIPLHRSYVDFQLLSYFLTVSGLPYTHIVAGEDFLKLGKLAELMRGSGAFFMRRTFRGDPMYGLLFREYVKQLVLHRQTLEFFIEGTRSRTGKTMSPKLGILKFITDAFFEKGQNDVDDVLFVPVSLSYDELLEAGLYAKELLGVPKPPENVKNMVKAGAAMRQNNHGCVNIKIGHTVSLRRLATNMDECPSPYQPKVPSQKAVVPAAGGKVSNTPTALLTRLGWRIIYELQRNIVISSAALVAASLECLAPHETSPDGKVNGKKNLSMTLSAVEHNVGWLKDRIQERNGRLQDDVEFSDAPRIASVGIQRLRRFVRLQQDGPFPRIACEPAGDIVTRVGVNISTNQLIHVFIDEALVSVVAHAYGRFIGNEKENSSMRRGVSLVKREVLDNTCHWLQMALAKEFPNYSPHCPYNFDSWMSCVLHRMREVGEEERLVLREYRSAGAEGNQSSIVLPVTRLTHFTAHLLFPHIEALYVVLLAVEVLFQHFSGPKQLPAKTVVAATFNSYKLCYEEGSLLEFIVAGNKETLQHYFENLIDLQMIKLVRVGEQIFYMVSEMASEVSKAVVGAGSTKPNADNGLQRIGLFSAQVEALRWHPSPQRNEDKKAIQNTVLEQFSKLMEASKI